jgi:hypothetical protein
MPRHYVEAKLASYVGCPGLASKMKGGMLWYSYGRFPPTLQKGTIAIDHTAEQ